MCCTVWKIPCHGPPTNQIPFTEPGMPWPFLFVCMHRLCSVHPWFFGPAISCRLAVSHLPDLPIESFATWSQSIINDGHPFGWPELLLNHCTFLILCCAQLQIISYGWLDNRTTNSTDPNGATIQKKKVPNKCKCPYLSGDFWHCLMVFTLEKGVDGDKTVVEKREHQSIFSQK